MGNSTVRAVNRLRAHGRWAAAARAPAGNPGTVFTAAGLWPLLALLADGSDGPARAELAQALGIPAEGAGQAARDLVAALAGVRGLRTATGLWTDAGLPLEDDWSAMLPAGARGTLTGDPDADAKALDAWASDRTDGLIERMPVVLDESTLMVLVSALTLRLRWIQPFVEGEGEPHTGPWAGRPVRSLYRGTSLLDRVGVAQGPSGAVTLLEVVGAAGVDVHLVLGEPEAPVGDTLTTGIAAVTRARPSTGASLLPDGRLGPGPAVRTVAAFSPEPRLDIETVAFEVRSEHDLLDHARLFGLETATDTDQATFPASVPSRWPSLRHGSPRWPGSTPWASGPPPSAPSARRPAARRRHGPGTGRAGPRCASTGRSASWQSTGPRG
ncbi:serpin family protein [Streptomyces virginiae]|uniref:serpin family protein n=1 Tax=Streptomyces virginiae TaxID=1961 RepID=UPI003658E032